MKCSLDFSSFLEEISSLPHSVVFLCIFALFIKKAFLSLLSVLWNSAFHWVYLSRVFLAFHFLLSSVICKVSSNNRFAFLHFFFLGMVFITAFCTVLWTSINGSSGTLSTRSNLVTSTMKSCRIWFTSYLNGLVVFPIFFNLSFNFTIRSSWREAQSALDCIFADHTEFFHLQLKRI